MIASKLEQEIQKLRIKEEMCVGDDMFDVGVQVPVFIKKDGGCCMSWLRDWYVTNESRPVLQYPRSSSLKSFHEGTIDSLTRIYLNRQSLQAQ